MLSIGVYKIRRFQARRLTVTPRISIVLLGLMLFFNNHAASAESECMSSFEKVRLEFAAKHDNLNEADHLKVEKLVGQSFSLCYSRADDAAYENLALARKILSQYDPVQEETRP